jgi:hypothetical protein
LFIADDYTEAAGQLMSATARRRQRAFVLAPNDEKDGSPSAGEGVSSGSRVRPHFGSDWRQ